MKAHKLTLIGTLAAVGITYVATLFFDFIPQEIKNLYLTVMVLCIAGLVFSEYLLRFRKEGIKNVKQSLIISTLYTLIFLILLVCFYFQEMEKQSIQFAILLLINFFILKGTFLADITKYR